MRTFYNVKVRHDCGSFYYANELYLSSTAPEWIKDYYVLLMNIQDAPGCKSVHKGYLQVKTGDTSCRFYRINVFTYRLIKTKYYLDGLGTLRSSTKETVVRIDDAAYAIEFL